MLSMVRESVWTSILLDGYEVGKSFLIVKRILQICYERGGGYVSPHSLQEVVTVSNQRQCNGQTQAWVWTHVWIW